MNQMQCKDVQELVMRSSTASMSVSEAKLQQSISLRARDAPRWLRTIVGFGNSWAVDMNLVPPTWPTKFKSGSQLGNLRPNIPRPPAGEI
jgi:hypothetical protein